MNITFDIETIPCQAPGIIDEFAAEVTAPGQYKKPDSIAEWLRENRMAEAEAQWLKTSFDGGMGQIVCIGFALGDEEPHDFTALDTSLAEEKRIIRAWFASLASVYSGANGLRPVLIGHNHIAFDIPFLWKRCMVHNIRPPLWFPRNPKPWAESVVDTMLLWDSTQRAGGSMDKLCKVLGIPGKGHFSGADVWPAIQAGKFDEVAHYCRADVERTRAMFKRMTFAASA